MAEPEKRGPVVDLIFDAECANLDAARSLLREACTELGMPPHWREWDRASENTPPAMRQFSSPTVLINGADVSDDRGMAAPVDGTTCCRIYLRQGRLSGVPTLNEIVSALSRFRSSTT